MIPLPKVGSKGVQGLGPTPKLCQNIENIVITTLLFFGAREDLL